MGCKLVTAKEERDVGFIHATPTDTQTPVGSRVETGSHNTHGCAAQNAAKPDAATQAHDTQESEDLVLLLPTSSSSCDFSPYYDPLPIEEEVRSPSEKIGKKSKPKKKVRQSASLDKADMLSDTSSRYSMSVERQRERADAPDTPTSNTTFNVDLGGSIRTASSSIALNGDTVLENHKLAGSHVVSDHPADPIALLLSPRQRTVSLTDHATEHSSATGLTKSGKKAGGPPSTLSNGPQKGSRRGAPHRDGDDDLVLACVDCGMEILDARATKVCPLTGKLHH